MADFSDDVDYEMDSAFLAEVDAIEASIEPPGGVPATLCVNKPKPPVARPFNAPRISKPTAAPSTPVIPKAPPPGSSFRPTGPISAAVSSSVRTGIRDAVRSALAASRNGSQASSTNTGTYPTYFINVYKN